MIDFVADYAGIIGLIFFFVTFVGIALWALNPAAKDLIESYKYIPLSEEPYDLRQ